MLFSYEVLKFTVLDMPLVFEVVAYSFIIGAGFLSYLVVVYEYNPLCFPQVPTYLVGDFLSWLEDTLFASCSCGWFPFLSKYCDQQTCYSCESEWQEDAYYVCKEEASGMSALGQFWHLAFFVRWQATDFMAQVASIRIFPFTYLSEVEGLNTLLQQAIDKDPVRGLDLDCFWLSISLPVGQIFAIFFISLAISPLFSWLLAVLQELVLLLFHLIVSMLYMAYAAGR